MRTVNRTAFSVEYCLDGIEADQAVLKFRGVHSYFPTPSATPSAMPSPTPTPRRTSPVAMNSEDNPIDLRGYNQRELDEKVKTLPPGTIIRDIEGLKRIK